MKELQRVIIALDVDELIEAEKIVEELIDYVKIYKVGPILFSKYGLQTINILNKYNAKIFIDLKLHDIPNTVYKTVINLTSLNIFMLTLHILGGKEMLKKAYEAAVITSNKLNIQKPHLLGVTILTSINQKILNDELKINHKIKNYVGYLTKLAKEVNLDGVIAAGEEIENIKKICGKEFIVVTPGVRIFKQKFDQKRIITPKMAFKKGADYIVLGREIITSKNKKMILEKL